MEKQQKTHSLHKNRDSNAEKDKVSERLLGEKMLEYYVALANRQKR